MNSSISSNTQAILLLTAPLITGRNGTANEELLTPAEYRRFARQLRDLGRSPSDLLGRDSTELLKELNDIVPADRVGRLLDRGFLITQAIERWQARAIWVLSRADSEYPKEIKNRLKEDSPALLYGCGPPKLLDSGGLAVVGSRHVDQALIEYTEAVGRQCALAKKTIISGGAQGIDRAAMRGALESSGRVTGVLADSLERAALNRENRNWLLDEQLALVSPYDPNAGFNVGHAMQRNKVIYALADAALVVSAEFEKGGTWAGATEQLQKMRFLPVYIRSAGEMGRGLQALARMGAKPWPNPQDSDQFLALFDVEVPTSDDQQPQLALQSTAVVTGHLQMPQNSNEIERSTDHGEVDENSDQKPKSPLEHPSDVPQVNTEQKGSVDPALALIACVREILTGVLASPKSESEVASALQVSNSQARLWLQKFLHEGILQKVRKPARFVIRQKNLL